MAQRTQKLKSMEKWTKQNKILFLRPVLCKKKLQNAFSIDSNTTLLKIYGYHACGVLLPLWFYVLSRIVCRSRCRTELKKKRKYILWLNNRVRVVIKVVFLGEVHSVAMNFFYLFFFFAKYSLMRIQMRYSNKWMNDESFLSLNAESLLIKWNECFHLFAFVFLNSLPLSRAYTRLANYIYATNA